MSSKTVNRKIYISINGEEVEHSYQGIRKELKRVSRELDKLTPGTKAFEQKSKELRKVEKRFDEVSKATGRTNRGLKQSSNLLGGLKGMIAGAFTIGAVQQLASRIISVRSEFEKYFAVLKTSLGSAKAANTEFDMIREFAAETPFSVRELTDSFVKLTNQGFKPTREEMRKLGDLAASTGKQYDQLAEAIIDAQTGEFERLKEFGIRAQKEGDKVTFTFKEQKTQVDFTSDAIQEYILSLGDLQGVSGSMAEISETLGGKISNLGDSWDTLLYNMGETDVFKDVITVLSNLLAVVNEWFEVPMSDKLKEEQTQLKLLETQLYNTSLKEEDRVKVVKELINQYPDYLGHLDAEKVGNEELSTVLQQVNADLLNRITLQLKEEEVTKAATKLAEAENDRFNVLQAINEELVKAQGFGYDATQFKTDQDFLDAAEEIIARYKNAQQGVGASGLSSSMPKFVTKLSWLLTNYKENLREVTEAESELSEVQKNRQFVQQQLGTTLEELLGGDNEDPDKDPVVQSARERYEAIITETKELHSVIGDLEDRHLKHSVDSTADAEELKRYQIRLTAEEQREALNNLVNDLQIAAEQFPQLAQVAKRAAQLQTVVDTYRGAQAAYNSLASIPYVGPALGAAAAAAAVVAGLARVKKIEQAKFAEGGITKGLGFKDETGHEVAGVVHEDEQIIPKWMRQSPRYAPTLNALEFARANNIGRYAEGGVATSKTVNNTTTQTLDVQPLLLVTQRLNDTLRRIEQNGVLAVADDDFQRKMQEKQATDNFITDNSRL